jgi:hypothetical protein
MPEASGIGVSLAQGAGAADSSSAANGITTVMADGPDGDVPLTMAEYKKQQDLVRSLIRRRQEVEDKLVSAKHDMTLW